MYIRTIDIAHPPLSAGDAEKLLDEEVRNIRSANELRVLKVVHGYGSTSGRSSLKEVVKNWSYINRKHLLAVISGEEYGMFDEKTLEMRRICGQVRDPDLGAGNQGITIVWIK